MLTGLITFSSVKHLKRERMHLIPYLLIHRTHFVLASVLSEQHIFPVPPSFSGNSLRKMPTCKCTWRRRATRRSGWVALMRNCCGVFRQASWALTCPPPPPPSIDRPLDQAPLRAHTPTINDTLSGSSCIKRFLFSGIRSPDFLNSLLNVPLDSKGRILHDVDGQTQTCLFLGKCCSSMWCIFQSPTPGILISDLKNCINDHASYCSKGNSLPSSFSIPPQRPTKQTCCDAAVDERPGHCTLQRAGSESLCLISMFSPPSTSPPSHPTLRMKDVRDIANIRSATTNTRSAFVVHSLLPATSIKAQAVLSSKITKLPTLLSKCGFLSGAC